MPTDQPVIPTQRDWDSVFQYLAEGYEIPRSLRTYINLAACGVKAEAGRILMWFDPARSLAEQSDGAYCLRSAPVMPVPMLGGVEQRRVGLVWDSEGLLSFNMRNPINLFRDCDDQRFWDTGPWDVLVRPVDTSDWGIARSFLTLREAWSARYALVVSEYNRINPAGTPPPPRPARARAVDTLRAVLLGIHTIQPKLRDDELAEAFHAIVGQLQQDDREFDTWCQTNGLVLPAQSPADPTTSISFDWVEDWVEHNTSAELDDF